MTELSDAVEASSSSAWRGVQRKTSGLRIVCDGNSLTAGQGSTGGQTYPAQLGALISGSLIVNKGVGAQTTQEMTADATSDIDPSAATQGKRNILLAWEMRNDMYFNEVTPQETIDNMAAYCIGRRARGFSLILVMNCIKMSGLGTGTWTENNRLSVNTLLAAQFAAFSDGVIDLAALPAFQDNTNTTYYDPDQGHLNNAGYGVVAAACRDAITAWR